MLARLFNKMTTIQWGATSPQRLCVSIVCLLTLVILFWIGSRYPDLMDEYQQASQHTITERIPGQMSKDALLSETQQSHLAKISTTAINWLYENRSGMAFGIALAGLLIVLGGQLPLWRQAGHRHIYRGLFAGLLFGMPLGLCTNCATPVAISLHKAGASYGTVFTTAIASPCLNLIGLVMLFILFPLDIALFRIVGIILILFVGLPFLLKRYSSNADDKMVHRAHSIAKEGWLSACRFFLTHWGINTLKVSLWMLPLMVLIAFTSATILEFFPMDSMALFNTEHWYWVILAVCVGVWIPIPMFFDLVIVYLLLELGISDAVGVALLIALPAISAFSMILLGKFVSWRLSLSLMVTVSIVAICMGCLFLVWPMITL